MDMRKIVNLGQKFKVPSGLEIIGGQPTIPATIFL